MSVCWNSPEGLWKQRLLSFTPRVSDLVGLGRGLKICSFLTGCQEMLLLLLALGLDFENQCF